MNRPQVVRPEWIFVFLALICEALYTLCRPPMQSPDEFNHFRRAFQISEGRFTPEKEKNRLGGELPVCLFHFFAIYKPTMMIAEDKTSLQDIRRGFKIEFSDKERAFQDFPNTAHYSPVVYLPYSIALLVLRQFKCSVGTMYYLSKLFCFCVWIIGVFMVIRLMPGLKWLFVLLPLLPMNAYLANSYSADNVTNLLSFMMVALSLKAMVDKEPLTKGFLICLVLISLLLALTKLPYLALLLLLWFIPQSKFSSAEQRYVFVSIVFICSLMVAFLWSSMVQKYFIFYEDYDPVWRDETTLNKGADYFKQLTYFKEHGLAFTHVVYNSFRCSFDFYVHSYVGFFGAYLDTPTPVWFVVCTLSFIIFVVLFEKDQFRITPIMRIAFLVVYLVGYCLLVLSLSLMWSVVASDTVIGIQGRYFIPLMPFLFLALHGLIKKPKINISWYVILFVIVSNFYCFRLLHSRMIKLDPVESSNR